MINHGRTLLLNLPGPTQGRTPGEEYVPDDYRPKTLPRELAAIYNVLFGTDPDRTFVNFRGRQLLQLIHATELGDELLRLDPRATYLPFDDAAFYASAFTRRVSRITGTRGRYYLDGSLAADERRGQSVYRWRVAVASADTIHVDRRLRDVGTVTHIVGNSGGLSDRIPLHGSDLLLRIGVTSNDAAFSALVGSVVMVDCIAKPQRDLGNLYAELKHGISKRIADAVFGNRHVEPYKTFSNLWEDHPQMAYSFSGLLLAYVYQVNELERR